MVVTGSDLNVRGLKCIKTNPAVKSVHGLFLFGGPNTIDQLEYIIL
jgi:hypothetical protein